MTQTDTRTEALDALLKGPFTEVAYSAPDEDVETCKLVAATARALAAERDTLAKKIEEMGEAYSKFADDYLKCAEKYQETVTLYCDARAEISGLKAQLAEAMDLLEEADMSISSISNYADRAWRGEVDAGAREMRRQIDCKFAAYWKGRALKSKPGPKPDPEEGLEAAAGHIEKKIAAYIDEHGSYDSTTGHMEYPGDGEEWVGGMEELAEEIRALKSEPAPRTSAE